MASLHRPLLFSALDKYLGLVINLVTTIVVARLLTPDEIGVFVVGGAVVVLAESLKDFGTSAYIVQRRDFDRGAVRTAFTIMLGLALLIALALALAARPIAGFYGDMRLVPVIEVAAAGVVLGAFAAPPQALLRRELAFGALAVINTLGIATNLVASVVCIQLGFGYLSLAFAAFIALAAVTAATILYRPKLWIFRPSLTHWRAVLGFGSVSSATALLNNFYQVLPAALLGRLAGFDAAGLYSRAMTLCQLPDRAIVGAFQPVIFPAFAAQVRAGGDLQAAYLKALTLLVAVQWPVLICIAIMAEPAVAIVLGPQWQGAAPVLRLLAIAYLGMTPAPLAYPTLVALGRVSDTLTASLISLPIGITAIAVSAPFGITAVAASMMLSWPLQTIVSLLFIKRQLRFAWRDLLATVAQGLPACIGAAAMPLCVAIGYGFIPHLPLPVLLAAIAGAAGGWLLGLYWSHNPLFAELRRIVLLAWAHRPSSTIITGN